VRDELEAPFLDRWLHDTEVPPPDPKEGARRVASRLPHTKQAGWWLPVLVLRRKRDEPTTPDTIEYQSSAVPATDGHTPTVIGRTQTMFGPSKALIAGALVFAIGGVFPHRPAFRPAGQRARCGSAAAACTDRVLGHV